MNESIGDSGRNALNQWINQPINQSIKKRDAKSTNQSIDWSRTVFWISRASHHSVDKENSDQKARRDKIHACVRIERLIAADRLNKCKNGIIKHVPSHAEFVVFLAETDKTFLDGVVLFVHWFLRSESVIGQRISIESKKCAELEDNQNTTAQDNQSINQSSDQWN